MPKVDLLVAAAARNSAAGGEAHDSVRELPKGDCRRGLPAVPYSGPHEYRRLPDEGRADTRRAAAAAGGGC